MKIYYVNVCKYVKFWGRGLTVHLAEQRLDI